MAYDMALKDAIDKFRELSAYEVTANSGVGFMEGKFKVDFFSRTFFVSQPGVEVTEEGKAEGSPSRQLQALLLHYLTQADGTPVANEWVAYRSLPGAALFQGRFMNMAINPLLKAYGNDIEGFKQRAMSLGGEPVDLMGDASFRWQALPRVPMACSLSLGDDEVPSSITLLFDAAASSYLPIEDLSELGRYVAGTTNEEW